MSKTYNPYDNVLKVVSEAAGILGYSDSDIDDSKCRRELKVAIPVRMMMGARRWSEGYRIQHSTFRGPAENPLPSGCQSG